MPERRFWFFRTTIQAFCLVIEKGAVDYCVLSISLKPGANRKSSILNLSINDVHFMKYSELKKITKAIDVAKLEENRINAFSEEKVKTLVKVKRNKGGYELC